MVHLYARVTTKDKDKGDMVGIGGRKGREDMMYLNFKLKTKQNI